MLEQVIYLAPSAFETGFMSLTHNEEDIDRTLQATDIAFASLSAQ